MISNTPSRDLNIRINVSPYNRKNFQELVKLASRYSIRQQNYRLLGRENPLAQLARVFRKNSRTFLDLRETSAQDEVEAMREGLIAILVATGNSRAKADRVYKEMHRRAANKANIQSRALFDRVLRDFFIDPKKVTLRIDPVDGSLDTTTLNVNI